MLFELLEVIPFVAGAALIGSPSTGERATLLLVAACLLLMPFVQLGEGTDFTMRTSIPALAILAVQISRAFDRSEEHTSELQSLMRNSYAVFCLQKKKKNEK